MPSAAPILADTLVGASRPAGGAGPTSYELAPDRLIAALGPNYELGRLIGRGGYAEVFAVRDLRLKRELALKVLRPDLILSDTLVSRFQREAEAVGLLQHPNIVPVFDVGEADGILWLLMPLVQGETLKSVLARDRRVPVEEARRILLEAAGALQTAHEAGVVHRDIKPENLMIEGKTRRVMLMDFGIAKAMDSAENSLTGTGVVIGTPQYMSPEQAMGKHAPDPRSDQYSLAVVGYQMLTGRVPFEGENVREVMARQLLEEPTPLSRLVAGIPASMSASIHQALRKEPRLRFTSMDAFARSLRGEMVSAAEGGAVRRESQFNIPTRKRPWLAAAGWAVVLGGAVFGAQRAGLFAAEAALPADPGPDSVPAVRTTPAPRPAAAPRRTETAATTPVDSAPVAPPPAAAPPATCESAVQAADWTGAFTLCSAEAPSSPAAHRRLGLLYAEGRGTERNDRLAALHLTYAADSADAIAVMEMARRYERGVGVAISEERAARKYLLAANLDVPEAFAIIARRYEDGRGIEKNPREAVRWYRRAVEEGDVPSMTRLAEALATGRGVKKDEFESTRWYTEAANRREPEAEYRIAMMLLTGKGGMKQDLVAGRKWLSDSANHGHPEAKKEMQKRGW